MQALEDRVASGGRSSSSNDPDTILTCVQCQEIYLECENEEGDCSYHPSPLQHAGREYVYVV